VLARPLDQRVREHKYRCAQALVFGLPVIALQYFGARLGGAEAPRWIAIMQIVLTGWILLVGGTGMLSEGAMLLAARRKLSADFVVASAAAALFIYSVFATLIGWPRVFHGVVVLMVIWSGARWFALSRQLTAGRSARPGSAPATRSGS
jgi:cation transport ATPase